MNEGGNEFLSCLECGATVAPVVDRVFLVGCEDVICMECALRRGGLYDENEDRWETEPQITDLLESVELDHRGARILRELRDRA